VRPLVAVHAAGSGAGHQRPPAGHRSCGKPRVLPSARIGSRRSEADRRHTTASSWRVLPNIVEFPSTRAAQPPRGR
jgi:hypothetical protein